MIVAYSYKGITNYIKFVNSNTTIADVKTNIIRFENINHNNICLFILDKMNKIKEITNENETIDSYLFTSGSNTIFYIAVKI